MAPQYQGTGLAMSRNTPLALDEDALDRLWATIRGPERALMQTSPFDPDDDARILAAIIESSEDAIIAKDLDGIILSWNRGAERMYGYSAREAIGRPISFLIPNDQRHEFDEILNSVRTAQRVAHLQTRRLTKDGRLLDVSLSVSPIKDSAGLTVGASTIARDITDAKRIEQALRGSEARWRAIVESAVDGIVVIDARGHVEAFNPAAERLFGYAAHEVVGQNVNMLMPAPYHDEHDGYLARYRATGVQKIIGIGREVTGLRKDGSAFPLHLSVGEVLIQGESKFTGILHDLTERVQLETQLREQSALTRLGEMAAVVAHEVKNPLTGIRGAIQVIGSRLPAGTKDVQIIGDIVARIDALNDLMKDLLLFARPPQPRVAPVDVLSLLKNVRELLRQDPALQALQIDVTGDGTVLAVDAELLKIVVQNLLLNGAHAMQGQGLIHAFVTSADGVCQISIADAGPGIPREILDKLFTPFFTTKARGTGLGLSTARRLVEAHGGTLAIESPATGGTTATIRLPVRLP
jgi:two-component system, LuxR family, sensor kinase FixL